MSATTVNTEVSPSMPAQPSQPRATGADRAYETPQADLDLLSRIARGDEQAFNTLYRRHADRLRRFLYRLTISDDQIDEAVNATFMVLWCKAGQFDPSRASFSTWLLGIVHITGLQIRAAATTSSVQHTVADCCDEAEDLGPTPERLVLATELGTLINWALGQLSATHRRVIELRFVDGLSYREIAALTKCSQNTVKTRVFHARRNLKRLIDPYWSSHAADDKFSWRARPAPFSSRVKYLSDRDSLTRYRNEAYGCVENTKKSMIA